MAAAKAPSILEALKEIKKGKLLPLYYLFGDDAYNLSFTLKSIRDKIEPNLSSDFDKETIYSENRLLSETKIPLSGNLGHPRLRGASLNFC